MEDTIHFMITGGTIDSFYNGTKDTVEPVKESSIPTFIFPCVGLSVSLLPLPPPHEAKNSRTINPAAP